MKYCRIAITLLVPFDSANGKLTPKESAKTVLEHLNATIGAGATEPFIDEPALLYIECPCCGDSNGDEDRPSGLCDFCAPAPALCPACGYSPTNCLDARECRKARQP